ncbi:MAG: hypothetical protein H0U95_01090 [Bacteroidetes bacterium]|nr:hypothetical protein [Bacteroidota bacterium]
MKTQTKVFIITFCFYFFCAALIYWLLAVVTKESNFYKWDAVAQLGYKMILFCGLFPMVVLSIYIDKQLTQKFKPDPGFYFIAYPTFFFGCGGPLGLIITWLPAIILYLIFK